MSALESGLAILNTKDQLVTGLLQPCLACYVSVAELYNKQQGIHKVYTDFSLIVMYFVRKKGHGHCTFSSRIIIIREEQVILPVKLRY